MSVPIIGASAQPQRTIEVCRSFSFKHNLGNYESADFFASRKLQCLESEAAVESERIYQECIEEVRRAIAQFNAVRAHRQDLRRAAEERVA